MRIIGVDFGDSRTGVAVSDYLGFTAQGLDTLKEKNTLRIVEHLIRVAAFYGASEFVVGLPKNMNGTIGERGKKTKKFAEELSERSGLPVTLWDERLSSVSAHNTLSEGNVRGQKRKDSVDRIAAVLILQGYLESKR